MSRPRAFDDADALRAGGGAGLRREGRSECRQVEIDIPERRGRRPLPRAERIANPGVRADGRRTVNAEIAGRRHVGQPADVRTIPLSAELDRAHRPPIE